MFRRRGFRRQDLPKRQHEPMRKWPKPFRISLHHVEGSCLSITPVVKMASFGDIETISQNISLWLLEYCRTETYQNMVSASNKTVSP